MARTTGESTRGRILEAATDVFARQGYDGAGVAEICALAGVSKGAFYHHYPSKQVLFLELLAGWLGRLDEQIRAVRAHAPNMYEALLSMAEAVSTILDAAEGQLSIFLEFWNQAIRDPDVWAAMNAYYGRYREFFAELVAAGVEDGSLKRVEPKSTAALLVSLAVGIVLQGLPDPRGDDWAGLLRMGFQVILGENILTQQEDFIP